MTQDINAILAEAGRLEELQEKADPGPWEGMDGGMTPESRYISNGIGLPALYAYSKKNAENLALASFARSTELPAGVRRLVAEIVQLRGENDSLRKSLQDERDTFERLIERNATED